VPEEKFGSKTLCKNCRQVDLQPPTSENPAATSSSGLDSGTPSVYIEHIFAFCIVFTNFSFRFFLSQFNSRTTGDNNNRNCNRCRYQGEDFERTNGGRIFCSMSFREIMPY